MPGPEPRAASDNLLWPIDRVFLFGFAPAGLATAGTLVILALLACTCPDAHEALVTALFVGQGALWLVFAPIYLLGWVHRHPRRAVAETGWLGSAALAALVWLLNILVFAALMAAFGWGERVPWVML
ncbi:hypothetical protein SAMN02745121_00683 [Nannocystis exedens]|uniref:Uncharacterized protein n=1 Tax=Nannocystis exedens TaxID=54 RepID=A0A1I1TG06_9BACT|nr:hypothetical protein [Nannocystis exedens]PCC66587.1 hypothetical protein NAEX_09176 [Nannocystis exedens]SFD57499.1 hypothetical protein SAMN02745121_00683 [Nannocystis exedens]